MFKRILFVILVLMPLVAYSVTGPLEKLGKELDQTAAYIVIMTKLANDPLLNPLEIHVKIENGTAVLEGMVDTDIQYDRAVMLTKQTKSIEKVDADNLKIKDSKQPWEDMWITTKIKGELMIDKYIHGKNVVVWPINVSTKNGLVYVAGKIDNPEQKVDMINLIRTIEGVRDVRADLQVGSVKPE